jgi:hypothetical protein
MTIEKILEIYEPQLEVGITRLNSFKNLEERDAAKIFGPILESICRAADIPTEIGKSLDGFMFMPGESPDMNSARAMIELLFIVGNQDKPTDRAHAMDRQAALEAEVAGLDDRTAPLARRSKDGIEIELWEIRTGHLREKDAEGRWAFGKKIPGIVIDRMAANGREERLQAELDRRELEAFDLVNA